MKIPYRAGHKLGLILFAVLISAFSISLFRESIVGGVAFLIFFLGFLWWYFWRLVIHIDSDDEVATLYHPFHSTEIRHSDIVKLCITSTDDGSITLKRKSGLPLKIMNHSNYKMLRTLQSIIDSNAHITTKGVTLNLPANPMG